jgi:hypothetical protein
MRWFIAALGALVLAACASGQQDTQRSSAPPLARPNGFPLYPGATVIAVRPFTQKISANTPGGAPAGLAQGKGTYSGDEVLALSDASFAELSQWVDTVAGSPPEGYAPVGKGGNPAGAAQATAYGVDYALFERTHSKGRDRLLLLVMDPQQLDRKLGGVLAMIARFRTLPALFRAPIDAAAKARYGFSITQATQPGTPIGAAVSALARFQHSGRRGIVEIDVDKR